MLLVLVPIGIATVVGLVVLWPSGGPSHAQQVATTYVPPGTTYPQAQVLAVATAPCAAGARTPPPALLFLRSNTPPFPHASTPHPPKAYIQ